MSKRLRLCPLTGLKWRVARLSRRDWHADHSIASIDVSMHNPRCDGRYLDCQLHWAKPRFSAFEFSIGDTLQVHNYCSFGHPQHGVLAMEWRCRKAAAAGSHRPVSARNQFGKTTDQRNFGQDAAAQSSAPGLAP